MDAEEHELMILNGRHDVDLVFQLYYASEYLRQISTHSVASHRLHLLSGIDHTLCMIGSLRR